MDDSRHAHPSGQEPEPHLSWCRRMYPLADGSAWLDPHDCQDDYSGPRAADYRFIETLLLGQAPVFLLPYLFEALVDIAGEDWARHSLLWTRRLHDFASRSAFEAAPTNRASLN